jgi:tetrahydromethanopterin S-methyltransferase subunit B
LINTSFPHDQIIAENASDVCIGKNTKPFSHQEISSQIKRLVIVTTPFENSMTPLCKRTQTRPGRSLISIYR